MTLKYLIYTLMLCAFTTTGYFLGSTKNVDSIQKDHAKQSLDAQKNESTGKAIVELQSRMLSFEQQLSVDRSELQNQIDQLHEMLNNHQVNASINTNNSALALPTDMEDNQQEVQKIVAEKSLVEHIAEQDYIQREELARILDAEETDLEWSDMAESEIRMSIDSSESINGQITQIECRSTYCRIDGIFGDPDARNQLIAQLMALVPWEAEAFYQGTVENDGTGALYITKKDTNNQPDDV